MSFRRWVASCSLVCAIGAALPAPDSGLACLLLVARYHGLAAEPEPLRYRFGRPGSPFGASEILRAARDLGLKAREIATTAKRLGDAPLPAIAGCRDGGFVVLPRSARTGFCCTTPGSAPRSSCRATGSSSAGTAA